jgi:hypothetical protein
MALASSDHPWVSWSRVGQSKLDGYDSSPLQPSFITIEVNYLVLGTTSAPVPVVVLAGRIADVLYLQLAER